MSDPREERAPNLTDLAQTLELRWRLIRLGERVVDAFTATLAISLVVVIAHVAFQWRLPIGRIVLVVNGAGLVAALVAVALQRRSAEEFLIDADRVYGLKSLLVSAYEFSREAPAPAARARSGSDLQRSQRGSFERLVIATAEKRSEDVDPGTVYSAAPPRRSGFAAALIVALGILMILQASGWFDRPEPPYLEEALILEDAGRRLAERATEDDELSGLADEIRRLGEQVRGGELEADQARRRIDQLNEQIESQIRDLERTPPLDYNEDAEIPPETESTIRSALRSGMSQDEVTQFFTRMRSEGNTIPDVVRALEEATPDRQPNANLDVDEEQMQELMDQLNAPRGPDDADSDIVNELEESQRALQQMGSGLAELTEGDDTETGTAEDSGVGLGSGRGSPDEPPSPSDEQDGEQGAGQQGGTLEMDDQMDDDFARPEESSPVFREIQGIVTDNTIMDVIIRELPSEATSELTEQEREVLFERIIEEAIDREETPPELQRLVRNYFLRLTMAAEQGDADEQ